MRTVPVTDRCLKQLHTGKHVCFGISPFNSYFSEARIRQLATWGLQTFGSMHFFIPDIPSAYTLEAIGYPPDKAEYKARRQCQYLTNKILRALASLNLSAETANRMLLNWPALQENTRFLKLYADVKTRFAEDSNFRDACLDASRWVLEKRVPDTTILTGETLCAAARYLLAEIPVFLDCAGIVGAEASVFVYHQCPAFIEALMHGVLAIKPSEAQGFVVIDAPDIKTDEKPSDFNSTPVEASSSRRVS